MDGSVPTVSGVDMATQYKAAPVRDENVIRPLDTPYRATGGLAMLFGNLAPRARWSRSRPCCPRCWCIAARP